MAAVYCIIIGFLNAETIPTDEQKTKIEKTAQAILDARVKYPDSSLADLYDELTMPPELRKTPSGKRPCRHASLRIQHKNDRIRVCGRVVQDV